MAARYWVGGTAAWDGTAGTKWALTSGGAGGQAVPTSADDVFFDAASGASTVTISSGNTGAKSVTCTGFTGTLSFGFNLVVSGSVTFVPGMTVSGTQVLEFAATGTYISASKAISVTVSGGTLTLGDALNDSFYAVTVTSLGSLNTSASSYSITCGNFTNAGTVTLNGSTVTLTGTNWVNSGTVNAGTSTINITSADPYFQLGGSTYNNVTLSSTAAWTSGGQINNSTAGGSISGTLNISSPASSGVSRLSFFGNLSVGTMVASGASAVRRLFLFNAVAGSPLTLTVTTWTTISDIDFRDIALNTARSGTRLGNCGGNTNITFPAAKTVYWNLAGSQYWSATAWATSSGGAPAVNNFPLAQDTAVFDNTGAAGTITFNSYWNIGTINMSARTTALSLGVNIDISVYGNWSNGTGTTLTGSAYIYFQGRGVAQTVTSNGVVFPMSVFVGATSGALGSSLSLADAFSTNGSLGFQLLQSSSLSLNNNTLTCPVFINSSTLTRTIAFGTGNITVTAGGTVFNCTGTNLTVTGTPVVNVTYSGASNIAITTTSATEANSISFNFTAGTYPLTINSGGVKNLNFTGYAGSSTTGSFTIYGNLTLSAGMAATVFSGNTLNFNATSGINTITSSGKTIGANIIFGNTIGGSGTWRLLDNLTQPIGVQTYLDNGTLDLNGNTLTAGSSFTVRTGTKNLTFNGGTLVCLATNIQGNAFNNTAPTNFTTTAGTGTGTIRLTGATAKTFAGGGSVFNCTLDQGGAGALTVTGANTFSDISNTYSATGATTITLDANQTVSNFTAAGAVGKVLTLNSSVAGTARTLTKTSGTVSVDYMSIRDSTATGGATWYAGANSTNVSNNTGWIFSAPPAPSGFLMFFN